MVYLHKLVCDENNFQIEDFNPHKNWQGASATRSLDLLMSLLVGITIFLVLVRIFLRLVSSVESCLEYLVWVSLKNLVTVMEKNVPQPK